MRSLRKYRVILIFVVIFAAIGVTLLITSHAATPYTSNEGESGTLASGATIQSDTNASGGKYIQFGAPAAPPTQPPASGNPAAASIGFYPCDGAATQLGCLQDEANMLGRSIQSIHATLMTDIFSSANMANSGFNYFIRGASSNWTPQFQTVHPPASLTLSLPLGFGNLNPTAANASAGLTAVANGAADSDYATIVNDAKSAGYNNVTWRLGWEFDGNWMPWSSQFNPPEFVAAFRRVHDIIKNLMPGSKFDWCGDIYSYNQVNWDAAYPGDAYVDIIGMDTYDNENANTAAAFNTQITPSLQYQLNYAKAHGKQVSYPEWGLTHWDNPAYIQAMHDWINSLPASGGGSISYADYFNQNTGGIVGYIGGIPGEATTYPNSLALFSKLFSK